MPQFTNGHALLIGIGTYQHISHANVPITADDARAVQAVLEDETLCGYPTGQVKLLHDEGTTRAGILAALDTLAGATKAEDTVLLYYAGHGEYGTDGNYYLTTHDTKLAERKVAEGTGVSDTELIEKLRAIPAKRLLIIFNACHSGAVSPNLSLGDFEGTPPPVEATDAILSTGEGRIIMTACRPDQKSWIGHGQLTIFAQALVDGLRGQGYVPNSSGYVSAFGLYEHLYATVKENADELGHLQEPELTVLRGVGPFPVSLYRGASSLGEFNERAPLPADTAARTVSPDRSQRMLNRYIQQTINTGSGAIAQGGGVAAGERGVAVGGSISGGNIVTGDNNAINRDVIHRQVNTGGGPNIEGNVDTGGGDFVGRDRNTKSYTAFDQREQNVHGPQTNIAGDVNTSGGTFNSGIMNPSITEAQPDIPAELRKLLAAITQAGARGILDEDTTIDANAAVSKAINQATKSTPDSITIRNHLATAKEHVQQFPNTGNVVAMIEAINGLLK